MTYSTPKQFLLLAAVALCTSAAAGCSSANDDGAPPSPGTAAQSTGAGEDPVATAADLQEGECMTDSGSAADSSIRVVPCTQPHAFEVYATTELPAGEYPGLGEADAAAQEFCRSEFFSFVGVDYDASVLALQYFYPVETQWEDDGGRSVACLVGDADGAPFTGTLRDSNK
jgi:hypothetical protein